MLALVFLVCNLIVGRPIATPGRHNGDHAMGRQETPKHPQAAIPFSSPASSLSPPRPLFQKNKPKSITLPDSAGPLEGPTPSRVIRTPMVACAENPVGGGMVDFIGPVTVLEIIGVGDE